MSINKTFEGHKGSITSIALHPFKPIFTSSSKDGTCKLWDLEDAAQVAELTGLVIDPKLAPKIEVRGCCFSVDGDSLITIQCGKRGNTHLIE